MVDVHYPDTPGRLGLQSATIYREVRAADPLPREVLGVTTALRTGWKPTVQGRTEPGRQGTRIARRYHERGIETLDSFGKTARVTDQHRRPRGKRFQHDEAEALEGETRDHAHVGSSEPAGQGCFIQPAQESQLAGKAERLRLALEVNHERAVTGDRQHAISVRPRQPCPGVQQNRQPHPGGQTPDCQHDLVVRCQPERGAGLLATLR
jgi:hypothetical protein